MSAPEPALAAVVRELAAVPRLLVALDFDGVLAPIVEEPSAARPLPGSVAALRGLAALPGTVVALLSGRGLADLAAVSGLGPPIRLVGSHGLEFDDGAGALTEAQRARREALVDELRALVGDEPGVRLEAKPAGVAVHVRNAPREVAARVLETVAAGPAAGDGITATPGKEVLDLAVTETTKGAALDTLRAALAPDVTLFAGDDVTDETALARLHPPDVGLKIGEGPTAAPHRLPDPQAMTTFLESLLATRRG